MSYMKTTALMRFSLSIVFILAKKTMSPSLLIIASDEFKLENARYAAGGIWDFTMLGSWSTQLHLEYQYIERGVYRKRSDAQRSRDSWFFKIIQT